MSTTGAMTYAYIYAKIRALSSNLLHLADYEQLLNTTTAEEYLRVLSTLGYEETINDLLADTGGSLPTLRQFDRALTWQLTHQMKKLITSAVPPKTREFISIYLDKYYFESLKAIIESRLAQIPSDRVKPFVLVAKPEQEEKLYQLLEIENMSLLLDALPSDLQEQLAFLQDTDQLSDQMIPKVESMIDRYFFQQVWRKSSQLSGYDRANVRKIVGLQIDLINIEILLRSKILKVSSEQVEDMLIPIYYRIKDILPTMLNLRTALEVLNVLHDTVYQEVTDRIREHYEQRHSLQGFQRRIKEFYLVQIQRSIRGNAFHAGLLIGFLALKENELRNLRIIYEGILENLGKDFLREQIIPI